MTLTIPRRTMRRFIVGKQAYISRSPRWQGKAGVLQAIREGAVVQAGSPQRRARSHDIVLYGRVP